MDMKAIKADLEKARALYLAIESTGAKVDVEKASPGVKRLKKALSEALAEDPNPGPNRGRAPPGLEQPRPDGKGVEYEVGCNGCGFFLHEDGTARHYGARGGLLPRHAVEAWNEGPDNFRIKSREK